MNLSLNISVHLFKEDSTVIAYGPSLDLSGYGLTRYMFYNSAFNQNISNRTIYERKCNTDYMFHGCTIKSEFKPKFK